MSDHSAQTRRQVPSRLSAAAFLLGLAALGLPAAAEQPEEAAEENAAAGAGVIASAGFIYQAEADLDGPGEGTLQVNRFDAGAGLRTPLSDKLTWQNALFLGLYDYDFGGGGFAAGDPWETVIITRYDTQLAYRIDERWGVRAGGVLMFALETDAEWGDSLMGGGSAGVDYRVKDTLFLSAGLGVVSQIEDDAQVIPALGLNWIAAEDWTVRVGAVPVSGGAGAGAEVEHKFNDALKLGLGVLFYQRRFRLDDDGPAPEGVGEERTIPVRLRLGWHFTRQLSLHFFGGVALGGEVKLDDERGRRLREDDFDPAPYAGVRVFGRF
jgi:opacity protein-like surface antigen